MFLELRNFQFLQRGDKVMKNIAQEILIVLVITVSCVSAALLIA